MSSSQVYLSGCSILGCWARAGIAAIPATKAANVISIAAGRTVIVAKGFFAEDILARDILAKDILVKGFPVTDIFNAHAPCRTLGRTRLMTSAVARRLHFAGEKYRIPKPSPSSESGATL
jgi:hypothetical protein